MSSLLSDEDELFNGFGSETLKTGNHMARRVKRWNEISLQPKNSTDFVARDAIHEANFDDKDYVSPGQLYTTESGRLFHAGKILVALVGLPATSKTLVSVAISRYTKWLGVRTKLFHISEYRKNDTDIPDDYLSAEPQSNEGKIYKNQLVDKVINDMVFFFQETKGQIAIYDSLNIRKDDRRKVQEMFDRWGVTVIFIESILKDIDLINKSIENAIDSSDYKNWDKQEALTNYKKRLALNESLYETMTEAENTSFIKYINFGQQIIVNNNHSGYLINKIVFFLMNLRDKKGRVYLGRCGTSASDKYFDDELLNEEGVRYSRVLTDTVLNRIKNIRKKQFIKVKNENIDIDEEFDPNSLIVWTGPRKRTYDTGLFFLEEGIEVRQRNQLRQLHPGAVGDLSEEEVQKAYPCEYKQSLIDQYHYRFPRAESYHDLAVRMEPLLLELEHMDKDVLIIAHESTLRILYGYLMACTVIDVPKLQFTRNEIVELSFGPFCNTIEKIPLNI
ncbi:hypothetical protein KAFR_0A06360 [Kazachstania africana CBS 2517]|uniref:6-phosphofructo-2-kinase domain-containing protein n=1 Tax=Kazachstania africana (strain ATCC 22294 / BCRC 22015 / CBS 2517 / CECT 1963 / NBRC 1671 / NRRL Y-8276) TaxID=1071382 RepID=H2ANX1_KAZAF|nr:hypothetical protein KAFR_0A06360 [Kazachstania africana CBS 2517]CCF56071.1 hypothetical protein KAFR_0A06360 [Kazachstania africana CBS 2517]